MVFMVIRISFDFLVIMEPDNSTNWRVRLSRAVNGGDKVEGKVQLGRHVENCGGVCKWVSEVVEIW